MELRIIVKIYVGVFSCSWSLLSSYGDKSVKEFMDDVEAFLGETAKLEYHTSTANASLTWKHKPIGASKWVRVTVEDNTVNGYTDRFETDLSRSKSDGIYVLLIKNVQPEDAGIYMCGTNGHAREAEFTVLETPLNGKSYPNQNDEILIDNSCGLVPDTIQLSCSVVYHGVSAPAITWYDFHGNAITGSTTNDNQSSELGQKLTISSNATARWRKDGTGFYCKSAKSPMKHFCYFSLENPLYVFETTPAKHILVEPSTLACSANTSSQSCVYTWMHGGEIVGNGQQFDLNSDFNSGTYKCTASCNIRNTLCPSQPAVYHYQIQEKNRVLVGVWIILAAGWAVCAVLIAAFIVYYFCNRNRNQFCLDMKLESGSETSETENCLKKGGATV